MKTIKKTYDFPNVQVLNSQYLLSSCLKIHNTSLMMTISTGPVTNGTTVDFNLGLTIWSHRKASMKIVKHR